MALECAAKIEVVVARDEQAVTDGGEQVALECAAKIEVAWQ